MKPLFTIHEGEFLVGDHIARTKNLSRRFEVYVATKDEGTDLLLARRRGKSRPIRLQVKCSRSFDGAAGKKVPTEAFSALGWYVLNKAKLKIKNKLKASPSDFWIFVVHTFEHKKHFVVVPVAELRRRARKAKRGNRWHLYLTVLEGGRCYDLRGVKNADAKRAVSTRKIQGHLDYSDYLDEKGWRLLSRSVE